MAIRSTSPTFCWVSCGVSSPKNPPGGSASLWRHATVAGTLPSPCFSTAPDTISGNSMKQSRSGNSIRQSRLGSPFSQFLSEMTSRKGPSLVAARKLEDCDPHKNEKRKRGNCFLQESKVSCLINVPSACSRSSGACALPMEIFSQLEKYTSGTRAQTAIHCTRGACA
jgi:hypothetical protein